MLHTTSPATKPSSVHSAPVYEATSVHHTSCEQGSWRPIGCIPHASLHGVVHSKYTSRLAPWPCDVRVACPAQPRARVRIVDPDNRYTQHSKMNRSIVAQHCCALRRQCRIYAIRYMVALSASSIEPASNVSYCAHTLYAQAHASSGRAIAAATNE